MASGWNTGDSISNAVDFIIDTARAERDNGTVMTRLVDRQTLPKNSGYTWDETTVLRFDDPTGITETTELNDFRRFETSALAITPTMVGLAHFWTDRAKARLSTKVLAQTTVQMQNAFDRLKDKDLLVHMDTFASLGGAGTTITQGYIGAAAAVNATGRVDEPWDGAQATVLHSYQIKYLEDELLSGIGTYPTPNGLSEEVYRRGFRGMCRDTEIFFDNNLTIDSAADAKGGTFARGGGGAIVLVQGFNQRVKTREAPNKGGGGEEMYMYDDYGIGSRNTNWGTELYFDATAPTS